MLCVVLDDAKLKYNYYTELACISYTLTYSSLETKTKTKQKTNKNALKNIF